MQEKLESVSGFPVHFERISDSDALFTGSLGRYHFDSQRGHIISLYEVGDGFDELRAAMEISHGLLFFDGYPGVLGRPGHICALVTDAIHHPAMREILSTNGLGKSLDQYYDTRIQAWIDDVESLSTRCNMKTDASVKQAFFFLEAMLVKDKYRRLLRGTFSSRTPTTWRLADEVYISIHPLYPVDQLYLRKALVQCLKIISRLGQETRFTVIPSVIEEEERQLLAPEVFNIVEREKIEGEHGVSIQYKRDGTTCTVLSMDYSELETLRLRSRSCTASELSDWVNASCRGKDIQSFLRSSAGSE